MASSKWKPQIDPVIDRNDKQTTYQTQIAQYKKAIQGGFYFEAIIIGYACLEDRLRYMLFYLGILKNENDRKITNPDSERIRCFRGMLQKYVNSNGKMSITGIKEKRQIVESVFRFLSELESSFSDSKTGSILWASLHDPNRANEIIKLLHDIEGWCTYRNEIVHSLLNKNLDSLYKQLEEQAQKGFNLFRELDRDVQWVKRKNIRQKMNM